MNDKTRREITEAVVYAWFVARNGLSPLARSFEDHGTRMRVALDSYNNDVLCHTIVKATVVSIESALYQQTDTLRERVIRALKETE
jgi:hypothetical protein